MQQLTRPDGSPVRVLVVDDEVNIAELRAGGAGLGLSLVQAIVAAHRGTVVLASAPGDTTIAVTLPPPTRWHRLGR